MDALLAGDGDRPQPSDDLLWNIKIVVRKTGLSRASIYRYVSRNLFPPARRIGPNRVAWVAAEVISWIETRPRLQSLRFARTS